MYITYYRSYSGGAPSYHQGFASPTKMIRRMQLAKKWVISPSEPTICCLQPSLTTHPDH